MTDDRSSWNLLPSVFCLLSSAFCPLSSVFSAKDHTADRDDRSPILISRAGGVAGGVAVKGGLVGSQGAHGKVDGGEAADVVGVLHLADGAEKAFAIAVAHVVEELFIGGVDLGATVGREWLAAKGWADMGQIARGNDNSAAPFGCAL